MSTRPKIIHLLALVVMLSMVATTVSAQPSPARPQESSRVDAVDAVPVVVSDEAAASANIAEEGPPEPELVLTDPYVSEPVVPADTTGLPPAPIVDPYTGEPRETLGRTHLPKEAIGAPAGPDAVVQRALAPNQMPPTIVNFEGIDNRDGVYPPDTDGQVGPNHYVQMVNLSTAVYDKQGNLLYGPFHPNELWPETPEHEGCYNTNDGDVVVLYDQMADRWLLTQFGLPHYPLGPYYQCIAVSKGPEPTNDPDDWYPYTFLVHEDKMNDYPKMGVWPDGYYMTANQFADDPADASGAGAWVFERDNMLNGEAATFQYFDLSPQGYWSLLPSNLMGDSLPPAGAPNYFASVDRDWYGTDDVFHVFAFHVDWDTPADSTFSLVKDMFIEDYNALCPGESSCIPQPDTDQGLDALSPRPMMHLWYRNLGDHETLVVNHTVDVGNERAGIRWYEVRDPGPNAYVHQQSTFAPDDGHHRWMGSIAMDKVGNMALGYSIASETMYPSIRYTGRLAGDPLGYMSLGEGIIITGTGSQTGTGARWGDYSAMSVDPVDDCTFWYTQEYIETTGPVSWQTRIAAFRFPSCLEGTGALKGMVESTSPGNPPINHAKVTAEANPAYVAYSQADGSYGFATIPTGTYTVTAEAYGFQTGVVTGLLITEGTTTTQDFQLSPWPTYVVSGTVTDDTTGWPLYARIDIENYPYSPIWSDPVSGYYSVTLSSASLHTFTVSAWVGDYNSSERAFGLLTADATENFALTADLGTCAAPGYSPSAVAYAESFEASGVYTHSGAQDEWEWGTPTVWPFGCASGDNCWGTDLDSYYNPNADQVLTSTIISLSAYAPGTILTANWWQAWRTEVGFDYAYAEVSIDGGPWTEMWRGDGSHEWTEKSYGISAAAGGNVQFRWRLTSDSGVNQEGYYVDDVSITVGCEHSPGGLLVGNVYSATMTTEALPGAIIRSDLGESAVAMETPLDPNVDDSFYTIFSPAGSHAFTATLRGYGPDSATPTIVLSDTVRQDFYLPAPQMYVVSGTIADAASGWPLYASITVEGDTLWNDPATGYYSVTLPEAFPHALSVAAWVDGYEPTRHVVGPLTADATEDFALTADPLACRAPGYLLSAVLYEGFEGDTFPPDGWTSYDVDGAEESWASSGNAYLGDAAAVHLYGPQGHIEDGWLVTPVFTPTAASELGFWEYVDYADYYVKHSLLVCTADCDNPPTNYTEIAEVADPQDGIWQRRTFDVSGYADTPIRLAIRYEGEWADDWYIDEVLVSPTSCDLMSGGLVVGNVTDENTSQGIVGAEVTNDGGYAATTEETPDDPDVDDGFYTLFSPSGSRTFTATMAYYQPDTAAVTVVQSDTVAHDFDLSAGQLARDPDGYEVTLPMGVSTTVSLTLTNTGGVPFQFELAESPGAFVPLLLTLQGQDRAPVQQDGVPPYATPEHVERIKLSASPLQGKSVTAPWPPTGDVHLVLDDGSLESNIGLTSGGQFIWLNRFTPDPADFPFVLDQVSILFGATSGVTVTETVDVYVYEDTDSDGDPGTGASLLQSLDDVAVQAADSVTWSNYPVDPPLTLNGPGDVLIAVVNRTAGVAVGDHPAAQDQTESQGRSWVGFYTTGDPPDPPVLPPDQWGVIDDFGLPGNWMVRGSGYALAPDVPWLSEDPISGTVVTDQVVDITFDANEVDQPGEHHALLRIWNDTPYAMPNVYLTMTVTAPATWGRLAGTVSTRGHCDVNMAGLEGAEVLIENGTTVSTTTYADGTYVYWLEAGSYTVTISADGHVAADPAQVTVSAGVTTTLDVTLRSIEPCISVAPLSMEAAPPLGSSETQVLMLTNAGAGASTVSIQESPAAAWLGETPTAGTVGADSTFPVTVTFTNLPAVMPGTYTSTLVVNTQDAVNSQFNIPVTITVAPRPEPTWEKLVTVNDVLTDTFPATVVGDDIIEIVDQVWITWTGGVTFTLAEEWSDSLELLDYAVRGLPGGTAILPDYGTVVMPAADQMTVTVTDGPGEWGYVITKTFTVLAGNWKTGAISETLWVEGAVPQLDPKVLQFVNGAPVTKVYMPLVMQSG